MKKNNYEYNSEYHYWYLPECKNERNQDIDNCVYLLSEIGKKEEYDAYRDYGYKRIVYNEYGPVFYYVSEVEWFIKAFNATKKKWSKFGKNDENVRAYTDKLVRRWNKILSEKPKFMNIDEIAKKTDLRDLAYYGRIADKCVFSSRSEIVEFDDDNSHSIKEEGALKDRVEEFISIAKKEKIYHQFKLDVNYVYVQLKANQYINRYNYSINVIKSKEQLYRITDTLNLLSFAHIIDADTIEVREKFITMSGRKGFFLTAKTEVSDEFDEYFWANRNCVEGKEQNVSENQSDDKTGREELSLYDKILDLKPIEYCVNTYMFKSYIVARFNSFWIKARIKKRGAENQEIYHDLFKSFNKAIDYVGPEENKEYKEYKLNRNQISADDNNTLYVNGMRIKYNSALVDATLKKLNVEDVKMFRMYHQRGYVIEGAAEFGWEWIRVYFPMTEVKDWVHLRVKAAEMCRFIKRSKAGGKTWFDLAKSFVPELDEKKNYLHYYNLAKEFFNDDKLKKYSSELTNAIETAIVLKCIGLNMSGSEKVVFSKIVDIYLNSAIL